MDDILHRLVEWIQTASPQLWAILIKQVYTRAVVEGVWVVGLVIFMLVSRRMFVTWYVENKYKFEAPIVPVFMWMGWISAVIACAVLISDIGFVLLNPEYQAIQLILSQLK